MSCTMLIRLPTIALSSDDLPTLGRPTIATTGMRRSRFCAPAGGAAVVLVFDSSLIRRSVVGDAGRLCQRGQRPVAESGVIRTVVKRRLPVDLRLNSQC